MLSTLIVPFIALQLQSKAAPPSVTPKPLTRPAPSTVLVTVNGTPITAQMVETALWDWSADDVIETLTNFEVVNGEAKRLHLYMTPDEVDKSLNEALAQVRASLPPGADVWTALKQKGYTPSKVRLAVRNSLLLDKITLAAFKATDYVDVSTIIAKSKPGTPDDPVANMKTAQGYYDQLNKGEKWLTVLAASTQDANILKNNGRIGWRQMSLFPPAALAELPKLKTGQVTHPVSTPYGVQIFRVNAMGATAPASELKQIKDEFAQTHRAETMKKLRDQAKIVKIK